MSFTMRMKEGIKLKRNNSCFFIVGVFLTFVASIISFFTTNLVWYFILLFLPGLISFLLSFYLRRYLGGAVIMSILLIFSSFSLVTYLMNTYSENHTTDSSFFFFIALASFFFILYSGKRVERGKIRERFFAAAINTLLLIIFILSFFYTIKLPCSTYSLLSMTPFLTIMISIAFFIIAPLLSISLNKCSELRLSDNYLNFALSLFSWGIMAGAPTIWMSMGIAAPCHYILVFPLLFLFLFLTLPVGTGLIGIQVFCEKFQKRFSPQNISFILITNLVLLILYSLSPFYSVEIIITEKWLYQLLFFLPMILAIVTSVICLTAVSIMRSCRLLEDKSFFGIFASFLIWGIFPGYFMLSFLFIYNWGSYRFPPLLYALELLFLPLGSCVIAWLKRPKSPPQGGNINEK